MRRPSEPEPVVKDPANPTLFGPPILSQAVTSPAAIRYAVAASQRHGEDRYRTPVSGGPSPTIPLLTAPAATGMSMAEQAQQLRIPPPTVPAPLPSMFQQGALPSPSTPLVPPPSRSPSLLPIDLLPDAAKQDPEFREGNGSMYALSQPNLARKYGVIRNKQHLTPAQLGGTPKGLRPETLDGLRAVQELQDKRRVAENIDTSDVRAEKEATEMTSAGAAARYGQLPPNKAPADVAEKARAEEVLRNTGDLDLHTLREAMVKDLLNNDEQRDIVEKRLKPLDLDELVMTGRIQQRVPVVPGLFEPTFESLSAKEDLAIKRLIMLESKAVEISERYLLDKFSLMSVVLAINAINGNVLPTHRDAQGQFNEDAFAAKLDLISKYPTHMISSLGVHSFWFEVRVRKLFRAENLGNG